MNAHARHYLFLGLFLLSAAGCDESCIFDAAKPGIGASEGAGNSTGPSFEVKKIEGTNVLLSTDKSGNHHKGIHRGTARVVDGCLFVGDALVVWPAAGGLALAKDALAKAAAGSDAVFELTGGGKSTTEGDAKLDVSGFGLKCSADELWFAHLVTVKTGDKAGSKRVGKVGRRSFEIKAIDEIDVFFSTDTSGNKDKALHHGVPRVVDGCLFVGDALVVWPATALDRAKDALAKAKEGRAQTIELSGGGLSVKEGDAKLDVAGLGVRCKVDEVWFAG